VASLRDGFVDQHIEHKGIACIMIPRRRGREKKGEKVGAGVNKVGKGMGSRVHCVSVLLPHTCSHEKGKGCVGMIKKCEKKRTGRSSLLGLSSTGKEKKEGCSPGSVVYSVHLFRLALGRKKRGERWQKENGYLTHRALLIQTDRKKKGVPLRMKGREIAAYLFSTQLFSKKNSSRAPLVLVNLHCGKK